MPIPFLLAGLGVTAGIIGAGGHISAKETNEKAQRVSEDAQELYNNAKAILEIAQNKTESALLKLGYTKKSVLDGSVRRFVQVFDRIKNIQLEASLGLDELSKFTIEEQDVVQLQEMSDIYQSSISSGATGAAAGAVIALAASGSLPVVTGTLSVAGSALLAGEVGMAAGLAGSALSFGAAMTPLAAVAAPVVLFTGISASMKADENLEKARTMYSQAESAAEQMKISETLCLAIAERSGMYNNLLGELNQMFSQCTALLDGVTKKKAGVFGNKKIKAEDLTLEEKKLAAVTRALAGAVKAVISTPMLSKDGWLSDDSLKVYNHTRELLPDFAQQVEEVEAFDYTAKAIPTKVISNNQTVSSSTAGGAGYYIRNVFALFASFVIASFARGVFADTLAVGLIAFSSSALLIIGTRIGSKFFKKVRTISSIAMGIGFAMLLYSTSISLISIRFFVIIDIILSIIWLAVFGNCCEKKSNIGKLLTSISGCLFCFAVALLIVAILHGWIGFSFKFVIILTEILFVPCAMFVAYLPNES